MDKAIEKNKARKRRQKRVRKKVFGTTSRPRLNVFKSNTGIYAQLIDDVSSVTLVQASTSDKELKRKAKSESKSDVAAKVGKLIGERAKEKKIKAVVFDRGGNLYHGRVKSLAEAAREAGLEF